MVKIKRFLNKHHESRSMTDFRLVYNNQEQPSGTQFGNWSPGFIIYN